MEDVLQEFNQLLDKHEKVNKKAEVALKEMKKGLAIKNLSGILNISGVTKRLLEKA